MNWAGQYVISREGQLLWRECMEVTDPALIECYRQNLLASFVIEASAILGVKVGLA